MKDCRRKRMKNKKIFLLIIMIGVLILLGKSDIYASTDNNGTVVWIW